MYLILSAFFVTIALTIWVVFLGEASVVAKVIVGTLFIVSFFLHPSPFPLAGFFLRIAISIFVLFYQIIQAAKTQ
jgi:hypothetical protein